MLARLYSTESGWNTAHTRITDDHGYSPYDQIRQADNPDHDDYGKYVLLIHATEPHKCDHLFASGNVPLAPTWFLASLPTGDSPPE